MTWIQTIDYDVAQGKLKKLYQRVVSPEGHVDNIMIAHSLKPHTMEGHLTLYKNVLHHSNNELASWYLEAVGVYVSWLNGCQYCVEHHFRGLKKLMGDDNKAKAIKLAISEDNLSGVFSSKHYQGLAYAKLLTLTPNQVNRVAVEACKAKQFTDGEILELNQVVSYFNYANRTVLGLGVELE